MITRFWFKHLEEQRLPFTEMRKTSKKVKVWGPKSSVFLGYKFIYIYICICIYSESEHTHYSLPWDFPGKSIYIYV